MLFQYQILNKVMVRYYQMYFVFCFFYFVVIRIDNSIKDFLDEFFEFQAKKHFFYDNQFCLYWENVIEPSKKQEVN